MSASVVEHATGRRLVAAHDLFAGVEVARFDGPIVPFAEVPAAEIRHAVWVGTDQWMIPTTPARFADHSCEPTCRVRVDDDDEIRLVTCRAVRAGEPLTFDYALADDLDDAEAFWDPRWTFQCECGAGRCRGTIDRYVVPA